MTSMLSRPSFSEGLGNRSPAIQVPDHHLRPPPSRNGQVNLDTFSPVNENGSFEFDRVVKSGRVSRRVKHKHVFRASWKPAYLVLRPNLLSVYKDEETTRLRVSINLSDVTAVAPVKSPRSHRQHVFGVFTPSKNYRFEAPSKQEAADWILRIRTESPADEDEAAVAALSKNKKHSTPAIHKHLIDDTTDHSDFELAGRPSSPEGRTLSPGPRSYRKPPLHARLLRQRCDILLRALGWTPANSKQSRTTFNAINSCSLYLCTGRQTHVPTPAARYEQSGLRIKGAVRQWKRLWVVLRSKNLAFYKDEQEYSPIKIISMSQVIDAAEVDPMSRSKTFCLQIIAEEKSYRLCAPDEESLDRWLGAFKSIIVARKKLVTTASTA
ncbi:hypothetical protein N7493_007887 [Penicillium malachiteum]|uniref:PH domain-containing protein n=1 Tax=Penicillium malachiteum TaxID=1324776 RepID=A0AAD6HIV7_9EURO|nr:hypothetical protein N7493_007887 [Penicillium malachiteum]